MPNTHSLYYMAAHQSPVLYKPVEQWWEHSWHAIPRCDYVTSCQELETRLNCTTRGQVKYTCLTCLSFVLIFRDLHSTYSSLSSPSCLSRAICTANVLIAKSSINRNPIPEKGLFQCSTKKNSRNWPPDFCSTWIARVHGYNGPDLGVQKCVSSFVQARFFHSDFIFFSQPSQL